MYFEVFLSSFVILICIFSVMKEYTGRMYTCHILKENRIFKLMEGSDKNSVIVVGFLNMFQTFTPLELIKNISVKYLDYQIRLPMIGVDDTNNLN